jgi:hypothetical protein
MNIKTYNYEDYDKQFLIEEFLGRKKPKKPNFFQPELIHKKLSDVDNKELGDALTVNNEFMIYQKFLKNNTNLSGNDDNIFKNFKRSIDDEINKIGINTRSSDQPKLIALRELQVKMKKKDMNSLDDFEDYIFMDMVESYGLTKKIDNETIQIEKLSQLKKNFNKNDFRDMIKFEITKNNELSTKFNGQMNIAIKKTKGELKELGEKIKVKEDAYILKQKKIKRNKKIMIGITALVFLIGVGGAVYGKCAIDEVTDSIGKCIKKIKEKIKEDTERFSNNTPSGSTPSGSTPSGSKSIENFSLEDIKEKIFDIMMQIKRSIDDDKFKNEKNKLEKQLIAKLEFYERKTQFTIDDILRYMNIPTNYYEATLEQVVIMNKISSNDKFDEEQKLNTILMSREMYKRFNAEEKKDFLKLSDEDQMYLLETFVSGIQENMENKSNNKDNKPNEETKPDNEEKPVDGVIIKEKTFLEKYLVFVIIGAILLLVIVYLLIS